ncbi:hydroxyisourate hydrolase-like isoform X4 [Humulus lupulus]|uniref:hydroxyisourate hydrolase-like isoform X4 n=1 Tax=Humulus lupulus TaxID=3486 RepID=UPI002B415B6D|nr:hydroxyisourate hydrolase-like isoform X4 [Humulus lupulus]
MLGFSSLQIFALSLTIALVGGGGVVVCHGTATYTRNDFPANFVFGAGTSAYQVEGAANEDGRTPSIWDTFAHNVYPQGDNGDVASDGYHKYQEDVQLMANMGLDAYRFSISWSRLIPNGRGPVNPKGLEYYNNLINGLLKHGIQPHVTLVNYDHPQALEDEYGGWVSRKMVKDFIQYADVCFKEFGDRVQYWTTVNEPNIFGDGSYDAGIAPPQRCSPPFGITNCTRGNSSTESYLVVHHILLAHASVVRLYRENYQTKQHGFVGLTIYTYFSVPYTDTKEDIIATQRANDFLFGWVLDPLVFGDYPKSMKKNAASRIRTFTKLESEMVKGAFDFIGVIHYCTFMIKDDPTNLMTEVRDFTMDKAVKVIRDYDLSDGLPIRPWGLEGVLEYLKQSYGNPPVFVYENGLQTQRTSSLEDNSRVEYIQAYIGGVLNALRSKARSRLSIAMAGGMDQTQEGISCGPSWTYLNCWVAPQQQLV